MHIVTALCASMLIELQLVGEFVLPTVTANEELAVGSRLTPPFAFVWRTADGAFECTTLLNT